MSEIATWSMIHSKVPSFPAPIAEQENECLTKNEILGKDCFGLIITGNYGDNECIAFDDIVSISGTYTGVFDAQVYNNSNVASNVTAKVSISGNVIVIDVHNALASDSQVGHIIIQGKINDGVLKEIIMIEAYWGEGTEMNPEENFKINSSQLTGSVINFDVNATLMYFMDCRFIYSGRK